MKRKDEFMNIVKILVIILLLYVAYKVVKMFQGGRSENVKPLPNNDVPAKGEDLVQDPFCKTYIPKSQAYIQNVEGREIFFCSKECCEKYLTGKK